MAELTLPEMITDVIEYEISKHLSDADCYSLRYVLRLPPRKFKDFVSVFANSLKFFRWIRQRVQILYKYDRMPAVILNNNKELYEYGLTRNFYITEDSVYMACYNGNKEAFETTKKLTWYDNDVAFGYCLMADNPTLLTSLVEMPYKPYIKMLMYYGSINCYKSYYMEFYQILASDIAMLAENGHFDFLLFIYQPYMNDIITAALHWFKAHYQCNDCGGLINHALNLTPPNKSNFLKPKKHLINFKSESAKKIFNHCGHDISPCKCI